MRFQFQVSELKSRTACTVARQKKAQVPGSAFSPWRTLLSRAQAHLDCLVVLAVHGNEASQVFEDLYLFQVFPVRRQLLA